MNSGQKNKEIKKILTNGLKSYARKKGWCKTNGWTFHRSAKVSSKSRQLNKLLGNSNWFRKGRNNDGECLGTKKTVKLGG